MRLIVAVAALGMMAGAPVLAPTSLMNSAEAQSLSSITASQLTTLDQLLINASNDPVALQAIVDAEIAAGNGDGLANALAVAAAQVAQSDTGAAQALATQAVTVASNNGSTATQQSVGAVVSAVASTVAAGGDAAAATAITTAATNAGGGTAAAYNSAGGSTGTGVNGNQAVTTAIAQNIPAPSAASRNVTPTVAPPLTFPITPNFPTFQPVQFQLTGIGALGSSNPNTILLQNQVVVENIVTVVTDGTPVTEVGSP